MTQRDDLLRIGALSRAVGLSVGRLRRLADEGVLPVERTGGGHRQFDLLAVREALARHAGTGAASPDAEMSAAGIVPDQAPSWHRTAPLAGLTEDEVWRDLIEDLELDTSSPVGRITAYAFNEMLNNAIDHSEGTTVEIAVWISPEAWCFRLLDDGVGVFARLKEGLGLPSELAAIAELTKGRRTTDPARHTGEGIFFTSKQVDVFRLSSGRVRWTVDNLRADQAVGRSGVSEGTLVEVRTDAQTTRLPVEVFRAFTEDTRFTRTRPSVKLFGLGLTFASRSEARRLLDGLDEFTEVELDFTGVEDVGQGFVDELLRVWPASHPDKTIIPTNMNEPVRFMVERAIQGAPPLGG